MQVLAQSSLMDRGQLLGDPGPVLWRVSRPAHYICADRTRVVCNPFSTADKGV